MLFDPFNVSPFVIDIYSLAQKEGIHSGGGKQWWRYAELIEINLSIAHTHTHASIHTLGHIILYGILSMMMLLHSEHCLLMWTETNMLRSMQFYRLQIYTILWQIWVKIECRWNEKNGNKSKEVTVDKIGMKIDFERYIGIKFE